MPPIISMAAITGITILNFILKTPFNINIYKSYIMIILVCQLFFKCAD